MRKREGTVPGNFPKVSNIYEKPAGAAAQQGVYETKGQHILKARGH